MQKFVMFVLFCLAVFVACEQIEESVNTQSDMGGGGESTPLYEYEGAYSFKVPLKKEFDWQITQSWGEHWEECDFKYPNDDVEYRLSSHVTCRNCRFGWDFSLNEGADSGKPVLASALGVVQSIGFGSGWGQYVVVEHGENICTRYAHMVKGSTDHL
ncbi:M23 family metallopeptidase, partial [Patescibacteria group bacterium]|nr:M23 family metallopeptidase [Patescibacteria group bacterium]